MAEPCSSTTQLNNNFPVDLEDLNICEWQEMDINEFNKDNMDTAVMDANQNIVSPSIDYNMNQCGMPDNHFNYDPNGYTDCIPEIPSSPTETMLYTCLNTWNNGMGYFNGNNFPERQYCNDYSPSNSIGDTSSSPDSSINDSYRSDHTSGFTLPHSQSWQPDEQTSDDSVEIDLTPLDAESPRYENYSPCQENAIPFNAYRQKQALPHFDIFSPPKHLRSSKRGRPVTYLRKNNASYNKYYYGDSSDEDERFPMSKSSTTKCKRGAKNVLLWKFLLEELRKPNGNHVQWVDEREGLFRFVDTTEVSKLWGQKKNKDDMNFEKLSRGIRHYYKEGLMARQEGTRLIYRFNWECVPTEYRRF